MVGRVEPAVHRVQAGTQVDNAAERKSLLKAGFQEEGVVRAAEFRAGQWRDCVLFSRLREGRAQVWLTGTELAPFEAILGEAAVWRVDGGTVARIAT